MDKRSITVIDERGIVLRKLCAMPTNKLEMGERLSVRGCGPYVSYGVDLRTVFEGCDCKIVSTRFYFKNTTEKTYSHNYEIIGKDLQSIKNAEGFVNSVIGIINSITSREDVNILAEPLYVIS